VFLCSVVLLYGEWDCVVLYFLGVFCVFCRVIWFGYLGWFYCTLVWCLLLCLFACLFCFVCLFLFSWYGLVWGVGVLCVRLGYTRCAVLGCVSWFSCLGVCWWGK